MTKTLAYFEEDFKKSINNIEGPRKQKAGALLSVIPDRRQWGEFLALVKQEWTTWHKNLWKYSYCLVVLYAGLAFYEYNDNTFWPQFADAVGNAHPTTNQQSEINLAYWKNAGKLGLKILHQAGKTLYVGSAVYQIGVPLSMWEDFLEICEWALWQNGWKTLPVNEWTEAITRKVGSRKRLEKFLLENREAASSFIQEMHDARRILKENVNWNLSDLKQVSLLRPEYFDEVPETAEFLRADNPESIIPDQPRLIWNEQFRQISLYLPAVKQEATWRLGSLIKKASSTSDELILNHEAFQSDLYLHLKSTDSSETKLVRGLAPWGLFDGIAHSR